MMELEEKLFLSQLVIEFLIEDDDAAEYEDLLTKIQAASLTQLHNGGIKFSEDALGKSDNNAVSRSRLRELFPRSDGSWAKKFWSHNCHSSCSLRNL